MGRAQGWKSRITGSGEEDPTQLVANPKNWRIHPKTQQDALASVLDSVGWVQQVLVNQRTGNVVDGHLRVELALSKGETSVPVLYTDLSEEEEATILATLDPISTMAAADDEKLRELLADLDIGDEGLRSLLDDIAGVEPPQGLTDEDDVPETPDEPYVKTGDLYLLGEHRLLCGDATEPDSYTRLLGGEQATMLFTDPPWNVAIGQDSNPRHRQREGLANDALRPEDHIAFLEATAAAVRPHVAGDAYVVLGAATWPTLDLVMREAGFHWSATIVWVKDTFVLGRSKFHRRYEPIWYGWLASGTSSYQGRRDLDDVWEIPRPKRSAERPTMKPVELVVRAIEASSPHGGHILDPFVGAGSTLIAAEQTDRRSFAMDIEPRYVQVAKERWEAFTGKEATLDEGQP